MDPRRTHARLDPPRRGGYRPASLLVLCAVGVWLAAALGGCNSASGLVEPWPEAEGSEPAPAAVAEPEPEPEPAPPPEPREHVVQPGDTFWGLAVASGCTVDAIKQASGIQSDLIYPGQTLRIPHCEQGRPSAPSEAEPTPLPDVAIAGEYRIRPGDYLELIAQRHGCSVSELMVANGLRSDVIYADQTLRIPECQGVAVPTDAPPIAENQYRIQPGDFLFAIASSHGCSVGEIMRANNLSSDLIHAGRVLTIPSDCTGEVVAVAAAPSGGPAVSTDTEVLRRLMRERGFSAPRQFKALVVEITFNSGRSAVVRERRFAYGDTADDTDWNPASSIKLFAAVAALQRARDMGFSNDAVVTFHGRRDRTFTLGELIDSAIGPSDNLAYNRLVQFVGYDQMNGQFLSSRNGLRHTSLRRAYQPSDWMEQGESSSFRDTPRITIREGARSHEIPARSGSAATACSAAACTTMFDLAELMRRLMLQEQLPPNQSFNLPQPDLIALRRTMRAERSRGEEVVDALARDFGADARFYHKAGFAGDWYSDNVYIFDPHSGQAWIVTMAGYPGRSSLNQAAAVIGDIISSGTLRRN